MKLAEFLKTISDPDLLQKKLARLAANPDELKKEIRTSIVDVRAQIEHVKNTLNDPKAVIRLIQSAADIAGAAAAPAPRPAPAGAAAAPAPRPAPAGAAAAPAPRPAPEATEIEAWIRDLPPNRKEELIAAINGAQPAYDRHALQSEHPDPECPSRIAKSARHHLRSECPHGDAHDCKTCYPCKCNQEAQ